MRTNFQACQDLIAVIDEHIGKISSKFMSEAVNDLQLIEETVVSDITQTHSTAPQTTVDAKQANETAVTRRPFLQRLGFQNKTSKKPKRNVSPITSGSLTPSDQTSRRSESTLRPPATLPQALQDAQVQEGSEMQASAANHVQNNATIATKVKWLRKRNAFMEHLEEKHASNDFIRDIVSMRALTNIHNLLVVPLPDGTIPEEVLVVQKSLQRLHRALTESNKRTTDHKPSLISIRILKASDYVQMKKKLALRHDYITFRTDTAIYPLQLESADPSLSTMIMAETLLNTPQSSSPRIALDMDVSLSRMLKVQAPEVDESFQDIGSIATPNSLADIHQLFQDISASWVIQGNLADFINDKPKCRTYNRIAVQLGISYMYFVSLASSHDYPRLMDYRYYDPAASEKRALGPDSILMPYLSVGFGSKAPKKSTIEFGGSTSHSLSEDEAMTSLGLLLHQVGCWSVVEEQDQFAARDIARLKRDDLIKAAGVPYAQVVDLCLASKEENWEPQAQADRIYKKVVGPLQQLVDELQ
jgi:hypothetical protein